MSDKPIRFHKINETNLPEIASTTENHFYFTKDEDGVLSSYITDKDGHPEKFAGQSDFDESDPTANGYVQNRTHYRTITHIPDGLSTEVIDDSKVLMDGAAMGAPYFAKIFTYNGRIEFIDSIELTINGNTRVITKDNIETHGSGDSYRATIDFDTGTIVISSEMNMVMDSVAPIDASFSMIFHYRIEGYDEISYHPLAYDYMPNGYPSDKLGPIKTININSNDDVYEFVNGTQAIIIDHTDVGIPLSLSFEVNGVPYPELQVESYSEGNNILYFAGVSTIAELFVAMSGNTTQPVFAFGLDAVDSLVLFMPEPIESFSIDLKIQTRIITTIDEKFLPIANYNKIGAILDKGEVKVNSDGSTELRFNDTNTKGALSALDASFHGEFNHNKLDFMNPNNIEIEYSNDGGSTWEDYEATDTQKTSLITTGLGSIFYIGKHNTFDTITVQDQLRVTITAATGNLYTSARKLMLNISTAGATDCKVKVESRTVGNYNSNTDTWYQDGTYAISGWSGWNSIPFNKTFGGSTTQESNYRQCRLTFTIGGKDTSASKHSSALQLLAVSLIGLTNWNSPSNLARAGHLYTYDANQNATFPARVVGTNIKSKGTATQPVYFDANGVATPTTYKLESNVPPNAQFSDTTYVFNTAYNATSNKAATMADIPKNISQLTNDSAYITKAVNDLTNYYKKSEAYTKEEVNNLVSVIPKFSIQVVETLPTEDISTSTIYLLHDGNNLLDLYTEMIYVNNAWETLGSQKLDISGKADTDLNNLSEEGQQKLDAKLNKQQWIKGSVIRSEISLELEWNEEFGCYYLRDCFPSFSDNFLLFVFNGQEYLLTKNYVLCYSRRYYCTSFGGTSVTNKVPISDNPEEVEIWNEGPAEYSWKDTTTPFLICSSWNSNGKYTIFANTANVTISAYRIVIDPAAQDEIEYMENFVTPLNTATGTSVALGASNIAENHSVAIGDTNTAKNYGYAFGYSSVAEGGAYAFGENARASEGGISMGFATNATGTGATAIGIMTEASADGAHAEGIYSVASGQGSHAEAEGTASGSGSHAEGGSVASGAISHAEGNYTLASGTASHTEGMFTGAAESATHAEGAGTAALGKASHVEGLSTIASGVASHVYGVNNVADTETGKTVVATYKHPETGQVLNMQQLTLGKYANIVGNGADEDHRSNAYTLDWDGNAWFAGDVYVGSTSGANRDDGSKKLVKEGDLSTIAFSGSYEDLTDKPYIPEGSVVDATLSDTSVNAVQNKIVNAALKTKANNSDLSAVAKSGSYNDLINKPANVSSFTNDAGYITVNDIPESSSVVMMTKAEYSALTTKSDRILYIVTDEDYL